MRTPEMKSDLRDLDFKLKVLRYSDREDEIAVPFREQLAGSQLVDVSKSEPPAVAGG